jgi:hypothetical protein
MGTAPINPNNLTTPVPARRNDPPVNPEHAPAATQHAPTPAAARDTSKTGPLDPTLLPPAVNLDQIHVPPPPPAPKKEEPGFFGGLWDGAKSVAHSVEHKAEAAVHGVEHAAEVVVNAAEHGAVAVVHGVEHAASVVEHDVVAAVKVAGHVVDAGVTGVKEGYKHGDGVIGALGDGAHAAGQTAFKEAIDPLMTHAIGAADKANDKAAGDFGPLLTNRLAVGDSVDIKIEAGTTLPTELVGAPNIKLDGGGKLKIKRVAAEDADGKPIMGPDGKQETRLEVELQANGRAGGEYSTKVGMGAKVDMAGHAVGFDASAKASAEAGLNGTLTMKLRFNPDNAKDMGDLLAMTKATAATGAVAALPGVGACLAALSASDYKRSFDTLGTHLEEVGGEGGLYAQASASAKLNLGVFKSKPADPADKGDAPPAKTGPDLLGAAADQAHGAVLEKLNLNIANIGASLGGQGNVGAKHNYRTGETTYSMAVSGTATAGGAVLGTGERGTMQGDRKINLIVGADGKIKDIMVVQTMTKSQFTGALTTVQDAFGRPLDRGVIAGIGHSDSVTVNFRLKPEIVQRVRDAHDMGAMAQAAMAVGGAAITPDKFHVDLGDIKTDHRDELAFKFDVGAALGAELDVRAGVTLGHDKERIVG